MTVNLEFLSPSLKLQLHTAVPLCASLLDDWEIKELFEPDRFRYQGELYGEYRVTLRYEVPNNEDSGSAYIAGCYLARQIDRVWTYSTGLPFGARAYDWFLTPTNPPTGWTSNGSNVLEQEDW